MHQTMEIEHYLDVMQVADYEFVVVDAGGPLQHVTVVLLHQAHPVLLPTTHQTTYALLS